MKYILFLFLKSFISFLIAFIFFKFWKIAVEKRIRNQNTRDSLYNRNKIFETKISGWFIILILILISIKFFIDAIQFIIKA